MTKLSAKNFGDFLKKPEKSSSAILFYGPDGGLVRERARMTIAALLGEKADPMALTELSDEQLRGDPARLSDECGAFGLMGGRRVILLRDAGDRSTKAIEQAVSGPMGENYLLVCAEELPPRSALRKLFEESPRLAVLPCYKDEAADIATLIRQKLDAAGIRYSSAVTQYLQQHLGNDRGVTASELDKILLYVGDEKELTAEAAELLVGHQRDSGLDLVALAIADRGVASLEQQLTQCFREAVQPVALLRAAQKHFQKLLSMKAEMEAGSSADQVIAAQRPPIFFRQVPQITRQLQQWSRPHLLHALGILHETELACKSVSVTPNLLCTQALTRIAAAGRR